MKTYLEPQKNIEVYDECDVLVIGGGPAGFVAATTASRMGSKTVLLERYGCLGGMSTGGLVLLFDSMCDGKGNLLLKGIIEEVIDRLKDYNGVLEQNFKDIGSSNKKLVNYWNRFGREGPTSGQTVRYSPIIDPEMLKLVANEMVLQSGVKLLLHSWAVDAIVDGKKDVKGVIFESKSGRKVIYANNIIDCTGDADIAAFAGADFSKEDLPLGLIFRLGNIDIEVAEDYINKNPEVLKEVNKNVKSAGIEKGLYGYPGSKPGSYLLSSNDSIVWFNNIYPGDATNVEDLTRAEIEIRRAMQIILKFYKRNIPGFENSIILDSASQIGTRGSRLIKGECKVTQNDLLNGIRYEDEICVLQPPYKGFKTSDPYKAIPYRALIPQNLNNLLVAGRSLSCDINALKMLRIIPPCMAMGQAAGTASAISNKNNISLRDIDINELQNELIKQKVVLKEENKNG